MRKQKIIMTVVKEDGGYSAHTIVGKNFIATEAKDINDLNKNILEAIN